jgi:AAA+ ATPase superfamily predicted ATPase
LQEPPFVVGKPVVGDYFVDREKELERLLSLVKGLQKAAASNSVLIGLRRTGKTSILCNLIKKLEPNNKTIPVTINCYGLASKSRFARLLVDLAITNYVQKTGDSAYLKRIRKALERGAKSAIDKVSELKFFEFSVKLNNLKADEDTLIEDALEYVEALAVEKNVYFVMILDEFQDVIRWKERTLKRIRTVIQDQRRTCYILCGSATTIMHDLVYEKRSPFYRQLVEIPVRKLEKNVVQKFLRQRFDLARIKIGDAEVDLMATRCEGFPDYVQRLGLELYLSVGEGGTINEEQIKKSYEDMLLSLDGEFETYFATLSPTEREILVAMASGKNRASEIAREARKEIHNMSKDLGMLLNYGIIERPMVGQYRMSDPVFSDWLQRRFRVELNP